MKSFLHLVKLIKIRDDNYKSNFRLRSYTSMYIHHRVDN